MYFNDIMDNEKFEKSFKIFWCFLSNLFNVQYNCKAIDIRSSKRNKSKQKTTPLSYVKVLKIVDGSPALIFFFWGGGGIARLRSSVKHSTQCFIRYPDNFKGDLVCSLLATTESVSLI